MSRQRLFFAGLALVAASAACGTADPVSVPAGVDAPALSRVPIRNGYFGPGYTKVSAAGNATCAITTWAVQCWGQMPQPSWFDVRDISVGSSQVCAILEGGWVDCTGFLAPPPPIFGATRVSTAGGYACAVAPFEVPSLTCWGPGVPAGVPTGDFVDVSASDQFACAVRSSGEIACWGSNSYGRATPPSPNSGFRGVTTGPFHACGLYDSGRVACWGENSFGRAAPPNSGNANFRQVSAGANHNCGVKGDGSMQCWGDFSLGQSIPPSPNSGFRQVDAGGTVTCAVRVNDTLDCWGSDGYGSHVPTPSWFAFSGFVPPILPAPAINPAIAGAPVVIQWSLGSNEGMNILTPGWPRYRACTSANPPPPTIPAAGQLVYDAASNRYLYIWNTDAAWAGTCQALGIKFTDGTAASVLKFQF